jgi:pyridoxamine 5'-phosphate oxidase
MGQGENGMPDRSGIFAGDDPMAVARTWLDAAAKTEPNDPNAMSLATVDRDGLPNVRIVLLKEIEPDGFVFYTNYGSAKAAELERAGKAALGLHWKSLGRQLRVRGTVARVEPAVSDAYFGSRALDSRIGAWASRQSQPLASRGELEKAVETVRARFGDDPPRPDHWGGYRLVPTEIEFWADGAFRLHDRFQWTRKDGEGLWTVSRLNP